MYIYKYEVIHESCFMIAEMRKSTPRNTYTQNKKIKFKQQWVKRRNLFYFEKTLFIITKEGWKIKYFLTKKGKTKKEERGWPFSEGWSFYMKNNLKSEIFNGKKI